MTDFTKTKISFALALLGTLFALHPFLEKYPDAGFDYPLFSLTVPLKVYYVFAVVGGLLAFTVYCYAVALVSERPSSWLEKLGNYAYAAAIMILPLYGALALAHTLAQQLGLAEFRWLAPPVGGVLALFWLFVAWRLRRRLGEGDRVAKITQLADQEVAALNRAREMFESKHYDLSVIESWRAIEARLRRVLLSHRLAPRVDRPEAMINLGHRTGIVSDAAMEWLQQLRRSWKIAVGTEPLSRESAEAALTAARNILSTIPIEDLATKSGVAAKGS
jgi:HEPN domain-containing protein